MLFDHALDHAGNRMRAEQAASAAATRWRDQQQSRVVVTDRRLLCQIRTKEWLTFAHAAVTAVRALPETRSVVLEYTGTAPVCLSGPVAVQVMVIVVWALYGADGLREHPALAGVRPALTAPPAPASARSDVSAERQGAAEQAAGDDQPVDREQPLGVTRPVDLLMFVAVHELVLAAQVAALLEISVEDATERLDELVEQGLVSRVLLSRRSPTVYRVTALGADRVDPALPPLRPLDPIAYRHAVGVTWLWAAARTGSLGEVREVLTRRQMQAADATGRTGSLLKAPGAMFREEQIDGTDLADEYPGLALVPPALGWASVDLVLGAPDPVRLRAMVGRAHRDKLLVQQLFVVEQDAIRELIESTATELGLSDCVHVRWLADDGIADS